MYPKSLLDKESDEAEDGSPEERSPHMNELTTSVEVIKSNYVTKEDLAILNGKMDVLAHNLQTFQAEVYRTFATKDDLSQAVYQLTWRMAGFGALLLSAGFAFARFI